MSELFLPSKLVEELAEERAIEMMRLQDTPIPFHNHQIRLATLTGASGHSFEQGQLLREVKGWVAIGIGAVADRISGLSLSSFIRGAKPEEDVLLPMEHPSNKILENPNPVFSMPAMLGLTAWWLNLVGQAFYQILHDAAGVPRELWPMPPDRVFPVAASGSVIGGYIVRGPSGQEIALETREVVRIWRPDPSEIYQSLGSLSPQATEFNAERFRVGHIEQTYRNDATPRLVLEAGSEEKLPSKPEAKAWGDKWREAYHRRRGQEQGIPAILPPGFKAHELGQTADGSMTVAMGEQLRDQMLSAMGVPGSIVGLVQDVNRAAAETNQYTFDKHGVMPKTKMIAAALTQQLAQQFDARIIYKFEKFLAPDKEFDLKQEQSDLTNKVRSVNQILAKRGLDDVDWGHLPVGSFNDVPYTGEEEDIANESAIDLGTPRKTRARTNRIAHVTDAMRKANSPEQTWARAVASERKFVSTFTRAMVSVFSAQADVIVKRFKKKSRITASDLFDADEFDKLFSVKVKALREKIYLDSGQAAFGVVSPGESFVFLDAQRRILDQIHADMVTRVNRETKRRITRALITGADKGESVDQIGKRISSSIISRKRARTIARTEVGKASQTATLDSFGQSAAVEGKQWNTSLDGDVRDSHAATEAQQQSLDEPFTLGSGEVAAFPLDPSLSAEELINCRCFITALFIEEGEGS